MESANIFTENIVGCCTFPAVSLAASYTAPDQVEVKGVKRGSSLSTAEHSMQPKATGLHLIELISIALPRSPISEAKQKTPTVQAKKKCHGIAIINFRMSQACEL